MAGANNPAGGALFEDLGDEFVAGGALEWGKVLSFECLRRNGQFVGMSGRKSGALIVKLPRDRVDELIDASAAEPFAPNGRIFKEWAEVPTPDEATWRALLEESIAFADASKKTKKKR